MFPEFCREPCLDNDHRQRCCHGAGSSEFDDQNNDGNNPNPVADLISKIQFGFCNPELIARPESLVEAASGGDCPSYSYSFLSNGPNRAGGPESRALPCFHLTIPPRFSAVDNETASVSSVETVTTNDDQDAASPSTPSILRPERHRRAKLTRDVDTGQSKRVHRIIETQVYSVFLVGLVLLMLWQSGHRVGLTFQSATNGKTNARTFPITLQLRERPSNVKEPLLSSPVGQVGSAVHSASRSQSEFHRDLIPLPRQSPRICDSLPTAVTHQPTNTTNAQRQLTTGPSC